MKYTTLAATELTPQNTVVSISPGNKDWYKLEEGFEFLVHINLKIQGAEVTDSDEEESETLKLLEQNKTEDICTISAILILGESISEEFYDPYELCDNYSGDLEFVYSVIKEYNLEFDEDKMKMRNIVYIDELLWNPEIDTETKKQVIDQLKGFIIHHYHNIPDVLCFYSAAIKEYESNKQLTKDRENMLNKKISSVLEPDDDSVAGDNVIDLNRHLRFSEDEINEHLGRRNKGETYPRKYINQEEFTEFENLGFEELGETRLLLKFI
ncbi:hypothetical protein SAMN04488100_1212 [Alkalibacterium putridalgicola]|uniref:Uncharacterized protein n=1 Tax=Alkalibacterium putridalgicola TaxID=426703 RepID=A0A1H7V0E2_9LACT|nr:hypothetical protein [Alkalibacterium putridalgicola]GEK89704.1 hypothetical protein APU01nite_17430 [Alkalibacterium putridalgicola]SEM02662.1 hypothetical protein SAMN04488100_1212 [Alkalibacterium putridalgicola]